MKTFFNVTDLDTVFSYLSYFSEIGIETVPLSGKEGFKYIKSRIFGLLKKYGPPDTVSKKRYNLGLVLFLIPVIVGWLLPYISNHIPSYDENRYLISISGDVILITSFIILGGEFWDKLRSLFISAAKVDYPEKYRGN